MIVKRIVLAGYALLLTLVTTAQQKPGTYEKEWKQIDSLISKVRLNQLALTAVNNIYSLAKKEGNDAQIIKAILYRSKLQENSEENLLQRESEIASLKGAAKALLQSIVAEAYQHWFGYHSEDLYGRTQTDITFKKENLLTWSTEDFHKKIGDLYLASLNNDKLLQQTKLEPFDGIITKGGVRYFHPPIYPQSKVTWNIRKLRPTLFDLLAYRAIEYFSSNERYTKRVTDAFEIDDEIAFADAKEFMNHSFATTDSASLQIKALQLYQSLLKFHASDSTPEAFIDADIARVVYVFNNATMENREVLYAKALERIGKNYGYSSPANMAWYYLAQWYANQAMEYLSLKNSVHRYDYAKAVNICNKVLIVKDSSEGLLNCKKLRDDITRITLTLETENVNVPGQPFRTLLTWSNFTQLHLRLVKIEENTKRFAGNSSYDTAYWKKLVQLPVIRAYTQSLPDTKDHQLHAAELKIDALPVGAYALIASINDSFSVIKNQLVVQYFYVSNIAHLQKGSEIFVTNRETGKPIPNAKVRAHYYWRDNKTNKFKYYDHNTVTNENGLAKLTAPPGSTENPDFDLIITTDDDHLYLDNRTYSFKYTSESKEPEEGYNFHETWLFTDRTMYRPGQTVYFKGIVSNYNSKTGEHTAAAKFTTLLTLTDPNDEKVDSLWVTTNEFGAYNGKFTLTSNFLNGQFIISHQTGGNNAYFFVEEYKRPKFQVEINNPTGTYKLNENIMVQGTAKAYAGNVIDGANVKYRVVRKTRMPYWLGRYSKIWPYNNEKFEVAHGEVTTDSTGNFAINFKAVADNRIAKKDQPTFYFSVSVDVTDAAGETRSSSTDIEVAYQALKLNLDIPKKMHTDSLNRITVTSTNMNNLFEKAKVTVSIHKLKTPTRFFRERYWAQPDTFVLSQTEYYKLFPYDEFMNENSVENWSKEQKVWEITDSTVVDKPFIINNTTFTPGWYIIEATTKDRYGEEVNVIQYIQLYDHSFVSSLASASIESRKLMLEPGEKAIYEINTSLDDAFIIHEVNKQDGETVRSFLTLNKASRSFEIPVTENDRGNFGVQIALIKHNRKYTFDQTFIVPYSNKELNIAYETFRDKTQPGNKEKWKVKISGLKGDKVAAEMLTSMYDASLDQFEQRDWDKPYPWPYYNNFNTWSDPDNFSIVEATKWSSIIPDIVFVRKYYDDLGIDNDAFRIKNYKADEKVKGLAAQSPDLNRGEDRSANKSEEIEVDEMAKKPEAAAKNEAVQIRKNFNETAFFFPHLYTDADGKIEFSFTMPEAVTQWKWRNLAHTKDLSFGYSEKTIVTQKDLMVQPNAPRFLREGDHMNFSAKIANITDKEITGMVQLQFFDATTNQPIDTSFKNITPNQSFTVPARQSVPVSFSFEIPDQYNKPVTYRLIAKGGNSSDGEEATLPVLSNRMLVTESLPLSLNGSITKYFNFNKLVKSSSSTTLNHHALTVEYTSNPAWYAVQALPYLMEYPYECAEQTFNRYYANALASHISNASPRIKQVFEHWKTVDTTALLSNLQKNQELKSILLQETPWVLQAKSETQQKKNLALLFNMMHMRGELKKTIDKLGELATSNSGFAWFKGGNDDRYITQYILTGIGHLKKLKALQTNEYLENIITNALDYADERISEDHKEYLKRKSKTRAYDHISELQIQYLYMRSFFPETVKTGRVQEAYTYYRSQLQKSWTKHNQYMQGMIALSLFRTGDVQTAKNIVRSLKENATNSKEMGMYWKDFTGGYYWYQSPIESQALMIETFSEVTNDVAAVNDMKLWLLQQKQTQNWSTTKATADACYALLLRGTDLLVNTPEIIINLGDTGISSKNQQHEAGTGYFKKVFNEKQVKPEMGNIKVTTSSANASWGAVYWQYFENLNKITPAATPLQLTKKLFIKKNTDRGPVLQPINEDEAIKVGDKVTVRIELRANRNMEYVHMKDMRAACLEPVNVISEYKWQNGLGYYESTKDASTNFFFSELPEGTYVFEYQLFATHTGTFSNGITTIQCMYAPEFTSHSEGVNVKVE